jgi:CRISPR-associated protein Csx14
MKAWKDIFIYVAGTTPQIITETLYALHKLEPPVHPDELYIITTGKGARVMQEVLLEKGKLREYCQEFNIAYIQPSIVTLRDTDGRVLDDILTERDNEVAGDFIIEFIRSKTKDEQTRLHCSIAGGRKTMSFYLGSALGLFGRAWDKLYHVLVTPEFESHPSFYWKPEKDKELEIRDSDGSIKKLNTKEARIYLADLPFIRLKDRVSLDGKSFRELVFEGQRDIDTASVQLPLKVSLSARTLTIGKITMEMIPIHLVLYLSILKKKLKECQYEGRPYCLDCTECFCHIVDLSSREMVERMAEDYGVMYGGNKERIRVFLDRWKEGIDVPTLRQNISKINGIIKRHIQDESLASFYAITAIGKHGDKRYGVRLDKGKIRCF